MAAVVQSLQAQVAWACRILAAEGYADLTLGHVSARGADGSIWIKRKGVALDEVEAEDVVSVEDTDAVLHLETVLHTGVYRVRADVGKDVPWAVLTAATLERAARLQSIAHTFGELQPIDTQLACELQPVKYRDEFVAEYWEAWQRQLDRAGGGLGGDPD